MKLIDRINNDIKKAILAKEKEKLEALRAIKAALLLANTSGEIVNEEAEVKLLKRLVKQRKEAAEIYIKQDRPELADNEEKQLKHIEEYLPEQMGEEQIRIELKSIIESVGASSIKDMGKVMGAATQKLSGKADNKLIAAIVRQLLD